jgi:hypothetical protein
MGYGMILGGKSAHYGSDLKSKILPIGTGWLDKQSRNQVVMSAGMRLAAALSILA